MIEELTEEQCSTRLLKRRCVRKGEADHGGDSCLVEKMRWPRFDVIPANAGLAEMVDKGSDTIPLHRMCSSLKEVRLSPAARNSVR
jgi:hypothetical protein